LADSDSDRAYLAGLKMLAARELSEAQVRTRLARRHYEEQHIDTAVARLRAEGAIDDARTARAIARTTASIRGQGKRRARARVDAAGISRATAAAAVDEVFGDVDAEALLHAALTRRLRGRTALADDREMARLFRYLVGQGFDADRVMSALRPLRKLRDP
jgi:regulatory protein